MLYAVSTWLFADAGSPSRMVKKISSSTADPTSPVSEFKKAEYIAAAQNELPDPEAIVNSRASSRRRRCRREINSETGSSNIQRRARGAAGRQFNGEHTQRAFFKKYSYRHAQSVQSLRSPNVKPDGFDLLIPPHQIPA